MLAEAGAGLPRPPGKSRRLSVPPLGRHEPQLQAGDMWARTHGSAPSPGSTECTAGPRGRRCSPPQFGRARTNGSQPAKSARHVPEDRPCLAPSRVRHCRPQAEGGGQRDLFQPSPQAPTGQVAPFRDRGKSHGRVLDRRGPLAGAQGGARPQAEQPPRLQLKGRPQ